MSSQSATNTKAASPTPHRSYSAWWDTHLGPILDRYCVLLCLLFVAIACARIVSTYNKLSLTVDEPFHLPCAIEYLSTHNISLDYENPPIARAVIAIGPYLSGMRPIGRLEARNEGMMLLSRFGHFDRIVFLLRLGNLPFFLLACLIVAAWSWHSFGKRTAVLATALFTLLPTTLAEAGLATTDMALGATVSAAFFAAMLWAERPTVLRGLLLGFCGALAALSKFTSVGYVPFAIFLALAAYLIVNWSHRDTFWSLAKQRLATFVLALATAGFLIWAAYWFSVGPVVSLHVTLPAPEFFHGLSKVRAHNRMGHGSFLLGEYRTMGWWYYFPVALAVKMPIAFLVLVITGIVVCLKQRARVAYLLPLAFSLGILVPAMFGHVDIGIRHIEPMYVSLSIIAALGLGTLLRSSRFGMATPLLACALVIWMVVSVARQHPDYLAYFNEFAGKHPENILVDSNYDWGQDLIFLSARLHQLGADQIALASMDGTLGDWPNLEAWYGIPFIKTLDDYAPSPGWNVVSDSFAKVYRLQLKHPVEPPPWYAKFPPTERVGALSLYYFPPGSTTPAKP